MRRAISFLLLFMMLLAIGQLSVVAEDLDDEEDISMDFILNPPTPAPAPGSAPLPTPEPSPSPEPVYQQDGSIEITLTAVGDVTIGRNVQHKGTSIFEKELKKQKGDPNFIFRNVKQIFAEDDLTIANFEGVLADTYSIPSSKKNNDFLFLASPEYANVLRDNSVEVVTMENNHINDFGEDGINSTIAAMENAGVVWVNKSHMAKVDIQGVRIGMLAYQIVPPLRSDEMQADALQAQVASDIARAKQSCKIVIVSFHWGKELDYSPRNESPYRQVTLGRAAIDAGADLVLGHHSHRINPIEKYNGRYIVYSLANCSFAGNNKPSDMCTFIFQCRFRIRDGEIVDNPFRIIPCRISSRRDYNDFAITPYTETENIKTVINTLTKRENVKNLEYAITNYPLEWE